VNEIKLAEASVISMSNHFHEAACSVEEENVFTTSVTVYPSKTQITHLRSRTLLVKFNRKKK
jgi:hypothetical protein